jgi:PhnB protein
MQLQPYLNFNGRCEEALEFYKKALDAEITMLMRFKDSPEPPPPGTPSANGEKVLHCSLRIGSAEFMASDGHCTGKSATFQGFGLSLALPNEGKAKQAFTALTEQGKIEMPLGKTFWSPCFGMVTDRFGVMWMITTPGPDRQ